MGGTPSLRSAAMHLGKYCEVQNNEFMLCRSETQDPRTCLGAGKEVTSCSMDFFRKVKATCAAEAPVEQKPGWLDNDKAKKLGELPANFPRNYKHWGSPGVHNENQGEV